MEKSFIEKLAYISQLCYNKIQKLYRSFHIFYFILYYPSIT